MKVASAVIAQLACVTAFGAGMASEPSFRSFGIVPAPCIDDLYWVNSGYTCAVLPPHMCNSVRGAPDNCVNTCSPHCVTSGPADCDKIHTHDDKQYVMLPAYIDPDNSEDFYSSIVFTVRASNDAHVGFFSDYFNQQTEMYEIVISGWQNTLSAIRDRAQGPNLRAITTPGLLDSRVDTKLWADVNRGLVRLGKGHDIGSNVLMEWQDPNPLNAMFVGIASGWGSDADWSYCLG